MKTAMVLALLAIVAVSSSARELQRRVRPGTAATASARPLHGSLFNFKQSQNAMTEFVRIDRQLGNGLIGRIMQNSDFQGGRAELAHDLENDDDMGIDLDNEAILFQCKGLVATVSNAEQQAAEIASGIGPGDADPLAANAWTLSSRPTSSKKLWLDFKGGNLTGTAWNVAKNLTTITIPPYDKDNIPTSFSTSELNDVVAVWRAVSEDYSPFDVDVTTVPQLANSSTTYMRVMIGGDGSWWGSAGGVAYVGVFGRSDTYYQPAFVFPKMLGPDYAKYIWEAASHEAGHTMGLSHDGTATSGYWQGNSANYGAIMGAGYYSQLTVWDKGEYVGANNQQDDTAIIAGKLGYTASENGNSIAAATPLNVTVSGSTATGTASGIVAQQNTPDVFSFAASGGSTTISVTVVIPWSTTGWDRSNLDAKVDIYNSVGLFATINPNGTATTNGLGISGATVTLPAADTYYLAVSGAGLGDPNTDTGYSSYGIRGQFFLSVTYPALVASSPSPSPSPSSPDPSSTPSPSPDPSPSPTPSPSPSPTPSPSPSPPPPPPAVPALTAAASLSCTYTGSGSNRKYTCTASVTVTTASGAAVAGATVSGSYSTRYAAAGFPTAVYTTTTATNGKATFTTAPQATRSSYSETFAVSAVTATGYSWSGPSSATVYF